MCRNLDGSGCGTLFTAIAGLVLLVMKVKGQTFTFVVKKADEGGYVAKCVELPQVHTEGETLSEVKQNMRDALSLTLDYLKEKVGGKRAESWRLLSSESQKPQLERGYQDPKQTRICS